MDVASILSLPPIDETKSTSASFPKKSNANSVESTNTSTLPPISSLLHPPIPEKTPTHHENSALLSQPYLQSKPNSMQLTRLEHQKSSANNSPSLLNLHSLSLEPTRLQSSQVHPSPPPTTPSL